jgi:hypothetical protein
VKTKTKTKSKSRCTKKIIVDVGLWCIGSDCCYCFRFHPCTFLNSGKQADVGIKQVTLNYNDVSFGKISEHDLEIVYQQLSSNGDGKYPWLPLLGSVVHFRDTKRDKIIRKIRRPDGY